MKRLMLLTVAGVFSLMLFACGKPNAEGSDVNSEIQSSIDLQAESDAEDQMNNEEAAQVQQQKKDYIVSNEIDDSIEYENYHIWYENSVDDYPFNVVGDVELPASFQKDGIWYKVVGISEAGFKNREEITSLSIPGTVEELRKFSVSSCENLESVYIAEGVTQILYGAFSHCTNLTSIHFPDSLEILSPTALDSCTALEEIYIPKNTLIFDPSTDEADVENVTYFGNCRSLQNIVVDDDNPYHKSVDGVLYNADMTSLLRFPPAKEMESFVVPETVTSIAAGAFVDSRITNIVLHDNITFIGNSAFSGTNIAELELPKNLSVIKRDLCNCCMNLKKVTLQDSVIIIEKEAFSYCTSLEELVIPDSVEEFLDELLLVGQYNKEDWKGITWKGQKYDTVEEFLSAWKAAHE